MSKPKDFTKSVVKSKPEVTWSDLSDSQKRQLILLSHLVKSISKEASLPKIAKNFSTTRQNLEKHSSRLKKEGK